MGGVVSPGRNNEELVDNLCKGGYINTPEVERVFRILDRKDYMALRDGETNKFIIIYIYIYNIIWLKHKSNIHAANLSLVR